jgi:hypothetical protein
MYGQLQAALEPAEQDQDSRRPFPPSDTVPIQQSEQSELEAEGPREDDTLDLGSISVASLEVLAVLARRGRYQPADLVEALTAACRDGHFEAAMLLAGHCADLSIANTNVPNPLHWLITFSQEEALNLLHVLCSRPKQSDKEVCSRGVRSLLTRTPEQVTVLLPHRCLKLHGTPLHWFVSISSFCLPLQTTIKNADTHNLFLGSCG